jgi:hypothetical protein
LEGKLTPSKQKKQVEDYLRQTQAARVNSERCRDYRDHKQWTAEEVAKLNERGQAPIVVNRVKPKVDGLLGLLNIRRSDPKAYPRTQKHEKSSEAITDALRFVTENNHFDDCKMAVAENVFVEGYGGAIVDVTQKGDDVQIVINEIPWDRIFFDPNSRKKDFSDSRYMGLVMWMDKEEAQEKFPDFNFDDLVSSSDDTTMQDKISWVDEKNERVRIAQHFYIEQSVWMMCFHAGDFYVIEPQESPYLDDEGEPCNPIELASAYIDRDNNRYGEVLGFLDQQDEINHRRSKALHLLSTRQTAGRKGAVEDVAAMKRELAKPNGHVEYSGEKGDFEILQTGDMAQGQFELYQDAKAEMDAVSFNAQLAGERQQGDLSGVAINKLQQAGTMELNGLFSALNGWEKRIYRQIWARIRQFWTEEKWIRVTDNQDALRWVGLNAHIPAKQWLEEQIKDESLDIETRRKAEASLQFLTQAAKGPDPQLVQAAQQGDMQAMMAVQQAVQLQPVAQAKLEEIVEVKNPVPEIMVDIILEQSFDVVNIQQEQFEMLAKFAVPGSGIDIIDLIRLSQIRGKEEVIENIEKSRKEQMQAQGGIQQLQLQDMQANTQKTMAETSVKNEEAQQKRIETVLLTMQPKDTQPQVVV